MLTRRRRPQRPDRRDRGPAGPVRRARPAFAPARDFAPGDIDFAQALANVLGDAFERQLTDDDIRHRALHDPLTGLPNRVLFLDRARARARPVCAAATA